MSLLAERTDRQLTAPERSVSKLARVILAAGCVTREMLPALEGTPAEVQEASYVREEFRWRHSQTHYRRSVWLGQSDQRRSAVYLAAVLSHTSAGWWLRRRPLIGNDCRQPNWLAPFSGDDLVPCDTCHATADLSGCRINDGATREEEPTLTCALCQAQERPDAGPTQTERTHWQLTFPDRERVPVSVTLAVPAEAA